MDKPYMLVKVTTDVLPDMTLEELCAACSISSDMVQQLIDFGIIEPKKKNETLIFSSHYLRRVRTVLHLQHDLEINLAGAALAIELMEELEQLRARVEFFEKHF